jgi:hypothetical protein
MNTKIPSQESRDKLKELSETFKPLDVKFLLALNTEFSVEECIDDAEVMVSGLKKYVDGNHSTDNLDSSFGKIVVY